MGAKVTPPTALKFLGRKGQSSNRRGTGETPQELCVRLLEMETNDGARKERRVKDAAHQVAGDMKDAVRETSKNARGD
jgi:hypothetical protein